MTAVRGFDLKKITDRKEKEGIYIHAGEWAACTVPLLSLSNFRLPAQSSASLEGLFLPQRKVLTHSTPIYSRSTQTRGVQTL